MRCHSVHQDKQFDHSWHTKTLLMGHCLEYSVLHVECYVSASGVLVKLLFHSSFLKCSKSCPRYWKSCGITSLPQVIFFKNSWQLDKGPERQPEKLETTMKNKPEQSHKLGEKRFNMCQEKTNYIFIYFIQVWFSVCLFFPLIFYSFCLFGKKNKKNLKIPASSWRVHNKRSQKDSA